jgi:hypothetical protein
MTDTEILNLLDHAICNPFHDLTIELQFIALNRPGGWTVRFKNTNGNTVTRGGGRTSREALEAALSDYVAEAAAAALAR